MATVVLVGTLDTKGVEYGFLRDRLRDAGVDVLLVDAGVLGEPQVQADVAREDVARAGGADHAELVRAADRGAAVDAMGRGAAAVLARLHAEGRLDGAAAVGGSGNSSIAAPAMRDLPVGVPKLIVSTVASGDTRPYVGAVDVTMMYSVVDIAGINQISSQILTNAAGAIAGMAKAAAPEGTGDRPLVGATMFGVTTPCVTAARERLHRLPAGACGVEHEHLVAELLEPLAGGGDARRRDPEHRRRDQRLALDGERLSRCHACDRAGGVGDDARGHRVDAGDVDDRVHHRDVDGSHIGSCVSRGERRDHQLRDADRQCTHRRSRDGRST